MSKCMQCPLSCGADRSITAGRCGVKSLKIAKACLHLGEEPCISGTDGRGSGTVFFSGCQLRCIFCQNMPISRDGVGKEISVRRLCEILLELQDRGAHNINLVTPTPHISDISAALEAVKPKLNIPVVYNCGGYESVEALKRLDGLADIYLPDFKYADSTVAKELSGIDNYPDTAKAAVAEMYRQTGAAKFFDDGMMQSGVLIRHMVLPSYRHDSMKVLDIIADTVPVNDIRISLLRQYTPCGAAKDDERLSRRLTTFEYKSVVDYALKLGFEGYTQQKESVGFELTPKWDFEGV